MVGKRLSSPKVALSRARGTRVASPGSTAFRPALASPGGPAGDPSRRYEALLPTISIGRQTDRKLNKRIHALSQEASRIPFEGTGRPEPLRDARSGYWSRRINEEHRMVYKVEGDVL